MEKKNFLKNLLALDKQETKTEQVEIEVVELFDDNGDSLCFELLSTIENEDNKYLVLTPFVEDETKIDLEVPAEVFVMQEIFDSDGEKMLEPVAEQTIVQRVFDQFRIETADKFDFADTDIPTENPVVKSQNE